MGQTHQQQEVIEEVIKHLVGRHNQKDHGKALNGVEEAPAAKKVGRIDAIKAKINAQIEYFKTPEGKRKLKIAAIVGGAVLGAAALSAGVYVGAAEVKSIDRLRKLGINPDEYLGSKSKNVSIGKSKICADSDEDVRSIQKSIDNMTPEYKEFISNSGVEIHAVHDKDARLLYGCAHTERPRKIALNLEAKPMLGGLVSLQGAMFKPADQVRSSVLLHEATHNGYINNLTDQDREAFGQNQSRKQAKWLEENYPTLQNMKTRAKVFKVWNFFKPNMKIDTEDIDKAIKGTVRNEGAAFMTSDHYLHGGKGLTKKYPTNAISSWQTMMHKMGANVQVLQNKSDADENYMAPYNLIADEITGARFYIAAGR